MPVYEPSENEKASPDMFAENVRQEIVRVGKEHGFECTSKN